MCNIYYIVMYKTTTRLHEMGLYNMEDRRGKIIEYVKGNSRCTKTEVIKDMEKKGIGSIKTIHPIIIDLLNEGILLVLKNRPNSQIHRLIINDKNEFNKIYKTLSDIQNLINKSTPYMYALPGVDADPDGNPLIDPKEFRILSEIQRNLRDNYIQSFILIFHIFYNKIEHSIHNEKDQVILFRKLNTLNVSLTLNPDPWLSEQTTIQLLKAYTKDMEKGFEQYNTRINIESDLGDKIIRTIENFKNQFLV